MPGGVGKCRSFLRCRDSPWMVPRGTAGSVLLGLLVRWQLPRPRSLISSHGDVKWKRSSFLLANCRIQVM